MTKKHARKKIAVRHFTFSQKRICANPSCKTSIQDQAPKNQKFCSNQCREEHYAEHYYGQRVVEKTCENPNCSVIFSTTCPSKQHYHSPECRREHRKWVNEQRQSVGGGNGNINNVDNPQARGDLIHTSLSVFELWKELDEDSRTAVHEAIHLHEHSDDECVQLDDDY